MQENAQDVNRCRPNHPQSKEDADLQLIWAIILDPRLSDDQVMDALRRVTAPYLGEGEEIAQ